MISSNLRPLMLKMLHQGQLVIENSRRQAREAIFWPGMSGDIAEKVDSCRARNFVSRARNFVE